LAATITQDQAYTRNFKFGMVAPIKEVKRSCSINKMMGDLGLIELSSQIPNHPPNHVIKY